MLKFLKSIFKKKPVFTQKYLPPNEEEQYQEIKCFRNGVYTHTVKLYYFTKDQVDGLHEAGENTK